MREAIEEQMGADSLALFVDGFDSAILGTANGVSGQIVVYSVTKMIAELVNTHGMSTEEAQEYFDFNIGGAYLGEGTPIFVFDEAKS